MLEILLRIVASKGTECSAELARKLGVSHTLMENMLDELVRQGYLKAVVGECSVPCERCPMHAACLFGRQARIWALSGKGESLLAKRGDGAF
ncbi:MAG: FeoC-like transcriptional regulator [Desulfuromonadales bacterium]